jgi:integrase
MPRIVRPLTAAQCRNATPREKEFKLFDGQGLYLLIKPNGTKSWRLKYTKPDGRPGLTALGQFPETTLKTAREQRREIMTLLATGEDPVERSRQLRRQAKDNARTFESVAMDWHRSMTRWSPDHARRVLCELEKNLFNELGKFSIKALKTPNLIVPLRQVELRGSLNVAMRLKQRLVCIFRFAVQQGYIEHNPALNLGGAIITRKAMHRPALPLEHLPDLLGRLQCNSCRPLTNLAMQLALRVFIRSSELRFARWAEIDLEKAMWTVPGVRAPIDGVRFSHRGSKMQTTHLVPLSTQVVTLLKQVEALTGASELVLPNPERKYRPLSENTVNSALRCMGFDTRTQVCGHGFRAMACSALLESGLWSRDAVERQMSHQERNGVRAAYVHKAQHLEERRMMMQWWADYLDANRQQHVTPYDFSWEHESARRPDSGFRRR